MFENKISDRLKAYGNIEMLLLKYIKHLWRNFVIYIILLLYRGNVVIDHHFFISR